jgi:hypothetical protein
MFPRELFRDWIFSYPHYTISRAATDLLQHGTHPCAEIHKGSPSSSYIPNHYDRYRGRYGDKYDDYPGQADSLVLSLSKTRPLPSQFLHEEAWNLLWVYPY